MRSPSSPWFSARRLLAACGSLILGVGIAFVPAGPAVAQDGQWWQSAWRMSEVWEITDGSGVTVAVLDSGVEASVPDLAGAVLPGLDLTGAGTDGRVDTGESGHGTGMASLIASRGTETGVVGVAPGATILPINVGSAEATGNDRALEFYPQAIRHAADNGAEIVSVSQGAFVSSPEPCPPAVAEAVEYAIGRDVVIVASTRNDPELQPAYPESCPGVVTVGALTADLEAWERSGRTGYVDVAAPGVGISAVIPGGTVIEADGTSNSTALVSGVVALLRAQFPEASAYEVVARLLATVEDVAPAGHDTATGYGMVRPYEALTASVPATAPNPIYDAVQDAQVEEPEPFVPEPFPTVAPNATGSPGPLASIGFLPVLAMLLVLITAAVVVIIVTRRQRRRLSGSLPFPHQGVPHQATLPPPPGTVPSPPPAGPPTQPEP